MKITTKICYGLRILEVLAGEYRKADGAGHVSSGVIAGREKISKRYADHLLSLLTISDLVSARHGSSGGYALTRDPSTITVLEAFEALEGAALSVKCLDQKRGCPLSRKCSGHKIWKKVEAQMVTTLKNTTLNDL